MGNLVQISEIPLTGLGYRARADRAFGAGEFKQLKNCELYGGSIRTAPPIAAYKNLGTAQLPMDNCLGFIGSGNNYTVFASYTEQRYVYGLLGGYVLMWSPTSLPVDASAGSWHRLVHFYGYNDKHYWITLEYIAGPDPGLVGTYRFWAHSVESYASLTTPYASLTHTLLFSFVPPFNQNLVFRNAFVQGERLWIVTSERVFFSAATDHLTWAAPSGGFFDFQADNFTYGTFYRDSIYILSEDSLYGITYNTDPNVDSTTQQISNDVGGDSIIVHDDTVYFANSYAMYRVVNNNADMFYKFELYDHADSDVFDPKVALTSFREYIYITLYSEDSVDSTNQDSFHYNKNLFRRPFIPTWQGVNDSGVYVLNMEQGSIYQLDFQDRMDDAGGDVGRPCEFIVGTVDGERRLMLLTRNDVGVTSCHPYYFVPDKFSDYEYGQDLIMDRTASWSRIHNKRIVVEIENWYPEDTRFLMKKFRSLKLFAELPRSQFQISFAFDNGAYGTPIPLTSALTDEDDTLTNVRPPSQDIRIPIMQRSRALSIKIEATNVSTEQAVNTFNKFSLSGLAVAWTPTNRDPVSR